MTTNKHESRFSPATKAIAKVRVGSALKAQADDFGGSGPEEHETDTDCRTNLRTNTIFLVMEKQEPVKETRTLIRIAASFDEGGNARAAVDFYGETDPEKQLELLGTLVFEAAAKTDACAHEIFGGKPMAFPGSKSKLNAHLDAAGAHIFSEETEKGTAGELLRCAVDGWLAKNPKYIAEDVAAAGLRHAKKSLTERQASGVLSSLFLAETTFAIGKTLPRLMRIITALRLIASIFKR